METGNLRSPLSETMYFKRLTLKVTTSESAASLPTGQGLLRLPAPPPLQTRGVLSAHPFGHLTNIYEHLFSPIISPSHTRPSLPAVLWSEARFLAGGPVFITRGHHTS